MARNLAKSILSLSLVALCASSCTEDRMEGFQTEGSVYFQTSKDNWLSVSKGTNYSFAGKSIERDTIWMQVNLLGEPADYDRKFTISVNDDNKAVAGKHYEAFQSEYIMKKGEMVTMVPVVLFNSEDLKTSAVRLSFSLGATSDLSLGLKDRTSYYLDLSNFLMKPAYWDEPYDQYIGTEYEGKYLIKVSDFWGGKYSRTKHEIMMKVLGQPLPEDQYTMLMDSYWQAARAYVSHYFLENYPVYDEDGEIIEPW